MISQDLTSFFGQSILPFLFELILIDLLVLLNAFQIFVDPDEALRIVRVSRLEFIVKSEMTGM